MDTLISHISPKSPMAEAYRTLRTNIQFADLDTDIKTIVFTSAMAQEGKTTTVSNMGIVSAKAGKRVLIIDADMRKPTLHKKFNKVNIRGLSDALLSDETPNHFIVKSEENGLDLMLCGHIPPNPSEILGSKRMRALIEKLKESYDLILIDAPPVGIVTDAQILASFVDGTIMVLRVGHGDRRQSTYAVGLLRNVNAHLLGVVLNRLPLGEGGYYRYKYYSYYGGAYVEENEPKKRWLFGRKKRKLQPGS
jgi:capsular exopolysaccharide synthesis family protein